MIVGIDPGKGGGLAYWDGKTVATRKFTTESDFLSFMVEEVYATSEVFIEDVPKFVCRKTSVTSAFTLGYNYGFHVGAARALDFSVRLVKPREWQKGLGLKPKIGYAARKRYLKDVAKRLFPKVTVINAVADALLIMDYGRRMSNVH